MPAQVLRVRSRGESVRELQELLLGLDFDLGPGGADGIFGPRTEAAVRAFQRSRELAVDGVVGRRTWAALREGRAPTPADRPPVPDGQAEIRAVFGDIELRMGPSRQAACYLRVQGDWEVRKIVLLSLEGLGAPRRLRCHRKLAQVFAEVFREIVSSNLASQVRSVDGCYCPRYKRRTRREAPSTHSWGIAVDLNARTNPMGARGDMHPGLVAVFRRHGFKWGGDWRGRYRDPMHFQYCTGY